MNIKTQKFLVLGVSKSGYAVAKYILQNKGKCYLFEELTSEKIERALEDLCSLGAIKVKKEDIDKILLYIDNLIISPGVPINHEIAVKAKNLGKRIIGELEFGFLQFTPPIVAVTGTNGKTTTVTLIEQILAEQGEKVLLVGNVGVPISSKIADADKDTICVAEVSSFQLESTHSFCPHVSCILNISPDHLERHYSMENYIYLKKRIFKNQKQSEYCVLNYDDNVVRGFASEVNAKTIFVSVKEKVDGAYLNQGKLYYFDDYIIDADKVSLKGEHNIYNCLFAIAVCKLMGVKDEVIQKALQSFKGVKHRMELIANKQGITFYNDSKATNTSSTISALEMIKTPTVLILGGSEKGEDYSALFEKIKNSSVKHTIITGASRFNMLESASRVGLLNLTITYDFNTAVKMAKMVAEEGDAVLLSPACASFDFFENFEERGERFRKIVEGF